MFVNTSMLFPLLYVVVMMLLIALVVVVAIVLIRLMLSATRALDAITVERKFRFDLLLSDDAALDDPRL